MGETLSKDCTAYLKGSAVIPGQTDVMGSSKNNIVLMNPQIHFHTNESATDSKNESTDERIKKLQEELKVKQSQIDLERNMRESEQVFYENLIREKDCQIEHQNKILNRHDGILSEQQAPFEKVYRNREERNRMENGPIRKRGGVNQHEGPAKRRKKHQIKDTAPYTYGHKNRPKSVNNFDNDPMELWEWDGTRWIEIIKNANSVTQIRHQVTENSSNKQSSKPKNQNSVVQSQTNVPVRSTVNDGATKVTVLSTLEQTENTRVTCRSAISSEHNYDANLTYFRQPEVANKNDVNLPALPNNISISFDEHEIRNHLKHDVSLFPQAPKKTRTK